MNDNKLVTVAFGGRRSVDAAGGGELEGEGLVDVEAGGGGGAVEEQAKALRLRRHHVRQLRAARGRRRRRVPRYVV